MKENEIIEYFNKQASIWDKKENISYKDKEELIKELNIKEDDLILDVACGTGVITKILYTFSKSKVDAIDFSKNMIEIAKKKYQEEIDNFNFICDDFLNYKFKKSYDLIVIYNAYPHFFNIDKLVETLNNNLKDNGRVAILHSMSLNKLNEHHKYIKSNVSRYITSFKEESNYFKKYFNIEELVEDHCIKLILRKKYLS